MQHAALGLVHGAGPLGTVARALRPPRARGSSPFTPPSRTASALSRSPDFGADTVGMTAADGDTAHSCLAAELRRIGSFAWRTRGVVASERR